MSTRIMVHLDDTYAGIVVLTTAQAKLLASTTRLRPRGPQWRSAKELERLGLIRAVIVEHIGCGLGEFEITEKGARVLKMIAVSPVAP